MKYKNILHIDDDEDDLEIFRTVIQDIDTTINCISVGSTVDALKKILLHKLTPEIIFLDLNMPIMNGFEFLTEFKKIPECTIPVIVLSTCSQKDTIRKAIKFGASGYLTKPNSIIEFVRLLTPLMEKQPINLPLAPFGPAVS
jgi:CheY-like chemotaxis protein